MIAPFTNQGFAIANSEKNSIADISSAAIVCRVDTDTFSAVLDSNMPVELQDLLDQPSINQNQPIVSDIQEWTPKLEAKFRRLAEQKALTDLSLKGKVEFEKLLALRRQLKNPRGGEEVLAEYQQRLLTRNLVSALTQYVKFHQLSHHSG